jgi:aminoglycoside phosphotransferase (APT) family kinase protein
MAQEQSGAAGDTIQVKDAHRFDEARLEEYLRANVNGFEGPLTVRQFEGGQSNPTYFLTTPARNYVLRRKPPGQLMKSAHAVEREYRVIHALNQTDFPVPHAYALCEDPDVIGTSFFVMSHVPGHARTDPSMPDLKPAARSSLVHSRHFTRWITSRWGSATSVRPETTSRARYRAGRGNIAKPKPRSCRKCTN